MASNLHPCPCSLDSNKGAELGGHWNLLSTEHMLDTQPNILHLASH